MYALTERDPRPVAELAPCLVDRVPIVRAEELHAEPRDHRLAPRAGDRRHTLGGISARIQRGVGDVEARRADADLVRDRM